jgi:hypothetical protein
VKVSDRFVSIIMNLLKKIHPVHNDLQLLPSHERILFDKLIHLGGLHKTIAHNSDKTINDLKKRLNVLHGELEIGNNNNEIKKEIYSIVHTLKNFKVITNKQLKDYLKQI